MKFGGKVFIIGVGKNEQVVGCYLPLSSLLYLNQKKFPFMHLSANEIDVSFQYRYANQVCKSSILTVPSFLMLCYSSVPQGHSPYFWRFNQRQAPCDS